MASFAADCLAEAGYQPVIAYYEPYSVSPGLSVPFFKLFQDNIGANRGRAINGYEAHGIGAWLPELEFTHYLPTRRWKDLIRSCQYHLAVSGNGLAATPFALLKRSYLAWIASGWEEDRKDRAANFHWSRKVLERLVNRHIILKLERTILNGGNVLALSRYTRKCFETLGVEKPVAGVMPMPIDIELFRPAPEKVVAGRIGFAGRLDDPRKNIGLLIDAAGLCNRMECRATLELVGGSLPPALHGRAVSSGLDGALSVVEYQPSERLAWRFQTMDVFVVPSRQEGLCIAALEAMACGCPAVSTRCGGTEEFVINGETGFLVEDNPEAMADAIRRIVQDRKLRAFLSENARKTVVERYNTATAKSTFWDAFYATFPKKAHGSPRPSP